MIPDSEILTQDLSDFKHPNKTYRIVVSVEPTSRINGFIDDDLESAKQAIYLILNTERYKYIIYSWDYGVELEELIGKPMPYVLSEIPRRVEEALKVDDRVVRVEDFEFEKQKDKLFVAFVVITNVGDFRTTMEVSV